MVAVTATSMQGGGVKSTTEFTLTAADTIVSVEDEDILIIRNATAGALTPILAATGAPNVFVEGIDPVVVSGGLSFGSIPAGQTRVLKLKTRKSYIQGTPINLTAATGCIATLLRF